MIFAVGMPVMHWGLFATGVVANIAPLEIDIDGNGRVSGADQDIEPLNCRRPGANPGPRGFRLLSKAFIGRGNPNVRIIEITAQVIRDGRPYGRREKTVTIVNGVPSSI